MVEIGKIGIFVKAHLFQHTTFSLKVNETNLLPLKIDYYELFYIIQDQNLIYTYESLRQLHANIDNYQENSKK